MSVSVHFDGRRVPADAGECLFDCAESLGVRVPTSCFRQGRCRECIVELEEGGELLSERTEEERHLDGGFRLSCRTRVAADEGTVRCHTLRRGALEIVDESSFSTPTRLDPAVRREDGRVVRDGEVLAEDAASILGVALDVGTTTVAARLYDLESGRLLATHSFENPQRFGGSDVLARIRYDGENRGRLLQRTLLGYLGHTLEDFPCDPRTIFEVVVAGNTTMRDLFFGLDVTSIGVRPYRSRTEEAFRAGDRDGTGLETPAKRLHLPVHPSARVVGLPLVSGHVGADAAAGLLASGLAERDELSIYMDVGTNTELFVGNRERILAASCPAGPAFEGGSIACGMPALPGAIERVRIGDDGALELAVIGGGRPVGVCGSGLVDALAELLRTGRMNAQGRFDDELEGRFVLSVAPMEKGERGERDVHLSEPDVNQLAQAKGANVAGLRVVLDELGVSLDDVATVYLAGGFARRLDVDAARRIGLVPSLPDERIVQVGNAALEGASLALRSASARAELDRLVRRIEHVELEVKPGFFDAFVEGCQFVPVGTPVGPVGER